MINDIFFLELSPEDLVDKMWSGDGASSYYEDVQSSAKWALFLHHIFNNVEFYVLDGKKNEYYAYDTPEFFVYVTLDGTPFDISGFHNGHDGIIDDNEFYSDRFGEVTHRKITREKVVEIAGNDDDISYFFNHLIVGED